MSPFVIALIAVWVVSFPFAYRRILRSAVNDGLVDDMFGFLFVTFVMAPYTAACGAPFIALYGPWKRFEGSRNLNYEDMARAIAGEERESKIKRLERQARERERRIAELEREVDLR